MIFITDGLAWFPKVSILFCSILLCEILRRIFINVFISACLGVWVEAQRAISCCFNAWLAGMSFQDVTLSLSPHTDTYKGLALKKPRVLYVVGALLKRPLSRCLLCKRWRCLRLRSKDTQLCDTCCKFWRSVVTKPNLKFGVG